MVAEVVRFYQESLQEYVVKFRRIMDFFLTFFFDE